MALYDAHNHLQDDWFEPHLPALLLELQALGVKGAVVNGSCEADWTRVSIISRQTPWLKPSFGLHPWDCGNRGQGWLLSLERMLQDHPNAAVGEIGIDRWMLDRAAPDDARLAGLRRAPLVEQQEVMAAQIELAVKLGRAASIHCLDAHATLLEQLRNTHLPDRGFLLHAYSGPAELVEAFAELGAYFSFNGAFVDPRKKRARAAFRLVPSDRLLVETDAPAMPLPEDLRTHSLPAAPGGETINHPGNIRAAYAGLAELLGTPGVALADLCAANFTRLFGDPAAASGPSHA